MAARKELCQQINGKKGNTSANHYIKGNDSTDGFLAFQQATSLADLTSDVCAIAFQSTTLKYWNGTTWATFSGGGGINSWDDLYSSDKTLNINGTTLTFNLSHATNNGLTFTSGAVAGSLIKITNSGTGDDIQGTSDTWAVTKAGVGTFTAIDGCDSLTAAANLVLEATGAGTISVGATSTGAIDIGTGGGAVTLATATTASLGITITAGGLLSSDGLVDIVDNANDASTLRATNDTQSTYGNASDAGMVVFRSESLTTGALLHLSLDETNLAGGFYIRAWSQDLANAAFSVGEYGVTVITGPAAGGSASLTVTYGDVSIGDGSVTIVDADNAASLAVTNDTATTIGAAADAGVVDIDSESLSTGALLNLSLDETALTTGWYLRCYGQDAAANVFSVGEYGATVITTTGAVTSLGITSASTTADVVSIATTALTTGDALQITSTAETLAAGELLKIVNTENGDASATPKTGNLVSVTSSVTQTTADATFDYDNMLISRSDISNNDGFTLTSQGSTLKILHTSTQTAGTLTDTSVGLEVEQSGTTYTGTLAQFTNVAVGAKTISVVSACTTVDDVLIAGTGVKADNKATLQVTNSGATAAGGSTFRVIDTGTPAAATSYLIDFDRAGATMTNNPVLAYMNNKDSTAAVLQLTGSGASAGGMLELLSTATGAVGAVLKLDQTANSAAANDVIGRLLFTAQDDANAAETYGRVDCIIQDATAANPDASLNFLVDRAGTVTLGLTVGWDDTAGAAINGIAVGDAAGAAVLTSNGAQDLVIETNGGTNSSSITLTDAANGDISVAINGTGNFNVQNLTYETNAGSVVAGTTTLAWGDGEGQIVFCTSAGGAYSITLPAAATVGAGGWYTFIKTDADANLITLDGSGAETIGEAGSAMATTYGVIDAIHDTVTIVCDGTSWYVVAQDIA